MVDVAVGSHTAHCPPFAASGAYRTSKDPLNGIGIWYNEVSCNNLACCLRTMLATYVCNSLPVLI